MINQPEKVSIQLKYKDVEKAFSASPEKAWVLVNKFFSDFLPSFKIARKLILSVDLQKLAKDCEGLIAFSKEGANLIVSKKCLTDNETLLLWLLTVYLGSKLGIIANGKISKEDLQTKLGKSSKITSTRLGELIKSNMVMKTTEERYKITTFGINQMQIDFIPKIKAKLNS